MDEVSDIAKAAGYNVVGKVTQNRESIDPAYCVGGHLAEARNVAPILIF